MLSIIIDPTGSFQYFFGATILTGYLFALILGLRQKLPGTTWSVAIGVSTVFFLIGFKALNYSGAEWLEILYGDFEGISYARSAPPGFLFGTAGLFMTMGMLRIRPVILDKLIIILPVISIIQRTGCLLNGCCYGTPCDLPWAVSYTAPSSAYSYHAAHDLIEAGSHLSLSVHPTQLYTIIGSVMIIAILIMPFKKPVVEGNRALLGFVLLGLLRFLVEFWRDDDVSQQWYLTNLYGMNYLQWILLLISGLIVMVILFRQKKNRYEGPPVLSPKENPSLNFMLLAIMLVITWNVREIFDFIDRILITLVVSVPLTFTAKDIYYRLVAPGQRILVMSVIFIAILSMAQVTVPDTVGYNPETKGWFSIGSGFGGGNYDEVRVQRDCSGNIINTTYFPRTHLVSSLDIDYHYLLRRDQHFRLGVSGFYYEDLAKEKRTDNYQWPDEINKVIFPRVSFDTKWIGVGFGVPFPLEPDERIFNTGFTPSSSIRVGPTRYFSTDFRYLWNFPIEGIPAEFQLGVGSGFGHEKVYLRAGYSWITESKNLMYITGDFLIKDRVTLMTNFAFPNDFHGSVGLRVHMGQNRWVPRKPDRYSYLK